MKRNELLSNRAYLPHAPNISRRDFLSPQKQDNHTVKLRHDNHNVELFALENNIRNSLEIKMKNEYEQIINKYQRQNSSLKQDNKQLTEKLNEYEQKIAGLYAQVEIKKAVRQNRKANLDILRKGPGMPQEFERAAEIYEQEIGHWRSLYEKELKRSEGLKIQLTKVDDQLDTLVADYLTDSEI